MESTHTPEVSRQLNSSLNVHTKPIIKIRRLKPNRSSKNGLKPRRTNKGVYAIALTIFSVIIIMTNYLWQMQLDNQVLAEERYMVALHNLNQNVTLQIGYNNAQYGIIGGSSVVFSYNTAVSHVQLVKVNSLKGNSIEGNTINISAIISTNTPLNTNTLIGVKVKPV